MKQGEMSWEKTVGAIIRLFYACVVDPDMPKEVRVISVSPEWITVIPQVQPVKDNVEAFLASLNKDDSNATYVSYDDPAGEMYIDRRVLAGWKYAYHPVKNEGNAGQKNTFGEDGRYLGDPETIAALKILDSILL